jgi:hypothetical protein
VVTERVEVRKYFWFMDPSVQFLLGHDLPEPEGATIHSIVPQAPVSIDHDKIGFTLDVAVRLDQEHSDDTTAVVVPILEASSEDLADSA